MAQPKALHVGSHEVRLRRFKKGIHARSSNFCFGKRPCN